MINGNFLRAGATLAAGTAVGAPAVASAHDADPLAGQAIERQIDADFSRQAGSITLSELASFSAANQTPNPSASAAGEIGGVEATTASVKGCKEDALDTVTGVKVRWTKAKSPKLKVDIKTNKLNEECVPASDIDFLVSAKALKNGKKIVTAKTKEISDIQKTRRSGYTVLLTPNKTVKPETRKKLKLAANVKTSWKPVGEYQTYGVGAGSSSFTGFEQNGNGGSKTSTNNEVPHYENVKQLLAASKYCIGMSAGSNADAVHEGTAKVWVETTDPNKQVRWVWSAKSKPAGFYKDTNLNGSKLAADTVVNEDGMSGYFVENDPRSPDGASAWSVCMPKE